MPLNCHPQPAISGSGPYSTIHPQRLILASSVEQASNEAPILYQHMRCTEPTALSSPQCPSVPVSFPWGYHLFDGVPPTNLWGFCGDPFANIFDPVFGGPDIPIEKPHMPIDDSFGISRPTASYDLQTCKYSCISHHARGKCD